MMKKALVLIAAFYLVISANMLAYGETQNYPGTDIAHDLTYKFPYTPGIYNFLDMVYDYERDYIFLTTGPNSYCGPVMLMQYNINADVGSANLNNCFFSCYSCPNACSAWFLTFAPDTDTLYIGSRGTWWGGLNSYSIDTGVYNRCITGCDSTWNQPWQTGITGNMPHVVYDSAGKAVYLAGSGWDSPGGDFFRYNTLTGTSDNLTLKLYALWGSPVSWSSNDLYAIAYDSINQVIYVGGNRGKLARYNTPLYAGTQMTYPLADTAYLINLSSTTWGSNAIYTLVFDPSDQSIYLGGSNGKFARLAPDSFGNLIFDDLSPKISAVIGTNAVYDLVIAAGDIYIGGGSGKFLKYNISMGVSTDLTDRISSFWGNNAVLTLAYDYKNQSVYLGGTNGRFARYNALMAIPATVDIKPDTLNNGSKSGDNAVTAYIEILGQDVRLIDISSLVLSTAKGSVFAQISPSKVGDYDSDGIADLMVKFNRQEVISIVDAGEAIEITITGNVAGMLFRGSDWIKVIQ